MSGVLALLAPPAPRKYSRKENWSQAEVQILRSEVEKKNPAVLFASTTENTWKRNCWKEIAEKINAVSNTPRTPREVIKKWQNLKTQRNQPKLTEIQNWEIEAELGVEQPQNLHNIPKPCVCIICNGTVKSAEILYENVPEENAEEFKRNFSRHFYLNPIFASDPSATLSESNIIGFCSACGDMARKLLELDRRLELLKSEIVETENWFKFRIQNVENLDGAEANDCIRKRWRSKDVKIEAIRDIIAGPKLELTRIQTEETCDTGQTITQELDAEELVLGAVLDESTNPGVIEEMRTEEDIPTFGVEETVELTPPWDAEGEDENEDEEYMASVKGDHSDCSIDLTEYPAKPRKRQRKENWTQAEVQILMSEVEKSKSVLFVKGTELKEKQACWKGISEKINQLNVAVNGKKIERTPSELRKKWSNLGIVLEITNRREAEAGRENLESGVQKADGLKEAEGNTKSNNSRLHKVEELEEGRYLYRDKVEFTGTEVDGFKCCECDTDWTFKSKNSLFAHLNIHIKQPGGTKCPICGKVLVSPIGLKNHLESHKDSALAICELCGKSCKSPAALAYHKLFMHRTEYQECELCGKRIKGKFNMKKHVNDVHLKQKNYYCELCGKGFFTTNRLKIHMLTAVHSTEKQFSCEICGVKFREKNHIQRHKRRFHMKPAAPALSGPGELLRREEAEGERSNKAESFSCDYCGLHYNRLYHLKRHLLQMHHLDQDSASTMQSS